MRARRGLILTIIQYASATANLATFNKPLGELSGMCKLTKALDPLQGCRFSFSECILTHGTVCVNTPELETSKMSN